MTLLQCRFGFGTEVAFLLCNMKCTMKINIVPSQKMLLLAAAVCAALFTFGQNANANRIPSPLIASPLGMQVTAPSSPYLLGTVIPGLLGQSGGQAVRDALMTNNLIPMALGTHSGANPGTQAHPFYSRSLNAFSPLPTATTTGSVIASGLGSGSGTSVSIDLSQTGTFTYLVAAYDGPNGGVAVWDIAGLTGTITFAAYAFPELNGIHDTGNLVNGASSLKFRITSWTLLNPISPPSVPDGGATVMLLGAALGALGIARRYIMS
jgi:hypothetical protein